MLIESGLSEKKMINLIKKLLCKIGWHCPFIKQYYPKDEPINYSIQAKCPWCGFIGKIDSQGNLF